MRTDVIEDTLDLTTPILETVPLDLNGKRPACYPLLPLRQTGESKTLTFKTVVLENSLVRATVVPDLGGRIISLTDRRTGTEILPRAHQVELAQEGPRGVRSKQGLQPFLGSFPRLAELGEVEFRSQEPEDESQPGIVFLHELVPGAPLSWTAALSLEPAKAEFFIEVRGFNRSLSPQPANSGFSLGWDGHAYQAEGFPGVVLYHAERDAGLVLHWPEAEIESWYLHGNELVLKHAPGASFKLGPRQLISYKLRFVPFSGLGGLSAANRQAVFAVTPGSVAVQASEDRPEHKLFLLTGDDQTMEAPAELTASQPLRIDISGLPSAPRALTLRDSRKEDLLTWSAAKEMAPVTESTRKGPGDPPETVPTGRASKELFDAVEKFEAGDPPETTGFTARKLPGWQSASLILEAIAARKGGDPKASDQKLEAALLTNSEDHLGWWLKGLVRRLGSLEDPEEERTEILNAHFLAPMEPLLRAEGFLAQSQEMGGEPNPMVGPLAAHPDAALEVIGAYLCLGLYDQATRIGDEILRHGENAMVRYLLAWSLLTGSRMTAEAAEQVAAAGSKPLAPPFPWRPLETRAIKELAERFPEDERLGQLKQILDLP